MTAGHDPFAAGVRHRPVSPLALLALGIAILAAAMLLLAGPGTQWGWWHFRTGFGLMRWAAYGGAAAAVVGLAAALHARSGSRWRGVGLASAALVIGLMTIGIPWQWQRVAAEVPPIHDISTDTEDPPAFIAIVPLRADAPNPPEYAGPETAELQRRAYPDVQPVELPFPPAEVFPVALEAARDRGWEIVDADPGDGRIEATDRTLWFGFADDVVIRIRPSEEGARLDVRSKSRIGGSDVGANARRIRKYISHLDRLLTEI